MPSTTPAAGQRKYVIYLCISRNVYLIADSLVETTRAETVLLVVVIMGGEISSSWGYHYNCSSRSYVFLGL
jgi:hypothetical protein